MISKSPPVFQTEHYLKDTAYTTPLALSSCHVPEVHMSWPAGAMLKAKLLSSTSTLGLRSQCRLLARWEENGADSFTISQAKRPLSHSGKDRNSVFAWLVLAYHPVLYKALTRALGELNSSRYINMLKSAFQTEEFGRIQLSWKNGSVSTMGLIASAQRV